MKTSSRDDRTSRLLTPPFVVAALMLGMAAVISGPVARWTDFRQAKEALPLKAPLSRISEWALAPYVVVARQTLEPALVEALGTQEYISWQLDDTSVEPRDPLRRAYLLITYYSGGSTLVPHTPDVCYLGAGYEAAQAHENTKIHAPSLGAEAAEVPIRVCTFAKSAIFHRSKTTVVYTFFCNGRFTEDRNHVRLLTHWPTDTYAFFSKVEVSFPFASRARNLEGAAKLFDRLLPALVKDHWPDFEQAERAVAHRAGGDR